MNLYVLRHAIAVEPGSPAFTDDSQRPLTGKGAAKMTRIASGLRKMGVEVDLILSSPYLRARQTAEILAKTFSITEMLIPTSALEPDAPASQIINEINDRFSKFHNIVLVGHQPYLNTLISTLISGDPTLGITLKKGGLCRLNIEHLHYDRCATLDWLLYPFHMAGLHEME
jgi:phosphohistidine phosphatase